MKKRLSEFHGILQYLELSHEKLLQQVGVNLHGLRLKYHTWATFLKSHQENKVVEGVAITLNHYISFITIQMIKWVGDPIMGL